MTAKRRPIFATIIMTWAMLALVASSAWGQGEQQKAGQAPDPAARLVKGDSDILPVGASPARGPADAPVTIVMFSEFQCPFCGRAAPIIEEIMAAYKGKVRVVFKHQPLPFHKDAGPAAQASMAAGEQGKFWEYYDLLWANQRALEREDLIGYAQKLGLDMGRFSAALDSGKFAKVIEEDQALADKVGANGTPTFFINGIRHVGAQPFAAFQAIIDAELKEAKAGGYAARVKANYKAEEPRPAVQARPPSEDGAVYLVPVGKSPTLGSKDAIVTVVLFADYQCPFCNRVQATLRQLMLDYEGKIRLVYKHLPLDFHKDADLAAQAAMAAGEQGKFWQMHDTLFENQQALSRADLEGYAEKLGLDLKRFKASLDKGKHRKAIDEDKALAAKVGARGTPHFFINGVRLSGSQPIERFKEAVDAAIERAAPLTKKGLKGDKLYNALMKGAVAEFKAPEAARVEADTTVYEVPVGASPARGPAGAPITVVVFSDFQCPFCSRLAPTLEAVEAKYKGKIQLVFKHNPLAFHKDARPAAIASMAAHKQGKFWAYYDLLWANQRALSHEDLLGYAQKLGLDMRRFTADLDDPTLAAQIDADVALAAAVTATGTPTCFINGRKLTGAQPQAAFEALIDELMAP